MKLYNFVNFTSIPKTNLVFILPRRPFKKYHQHMYKSWKQLWPFIAPYKRKLIIALFFGFLLAQFSIFLPIIGNTIILAFQKKTLLDDPNFYKLVNYFNFNKNHWLFQINHKQLILLMTLILPAYYFIFGLIRYFHFFLIKSIGEQIISDIRVSLMDKFMELDTPFLNHQKKGSASLLSRTLNDTMILQQGLQYYADLIREPIMALFLISYMFFINWQISLGACIFLPLFLGVIRYITKSLKKFGHQSQESLEEITRTLKEGLDGMRVVQSFNLQEKMKEKFKKQVEHYISRRKKIIKREELGSPVNEWIASVLVAGICLIQAQLIWGNQSDIGGFIAFLIAAGMLDKPVKKSQQAVIRIQQNVVALERLEEVLLSSIQVKDPLKPLDFPKDWRSIQFKNVCFSYNQNSVLKNINFDIKKGEVVALVGQSGAGKSTLVSLLQRFSDPDSGEILIGSIPLDKMKKSTLRSKIGYVTQDVFLFEDSVENNIWFGDPKKDKKEVPLAAKIANVTHFIENTDRGFQSSVGERGRCFSGGEKQRISIARAVFKNPPILVLDEATSALDSKSEQEVQKGIQALLQGKTALIIAHRLSTIINSDRILVMKNGQIIEEGTHQDLIGKKSEYAKLYKLQDT